MATLAELRHAIDADQLVLHYQPTVDLKSRQVTTAQALVRWQHPKYDVLGPDDFIPLAERTELIKPLTLWVLNHALKQHGAWKKEGLDIRVAVNLSAISLSDLDLPDLIAGFLTSHAAAPDRLNLEITETRAIVDEGRALQILRRLTDMGVRLSQDNFGRGLSSFAYLNRLPAEEVKIDRDFVLGTDEDAMHVAMVHSIIEIVHTIGREVVAEGTANEKIFTELEKLGCDAVQGAYISQPLSAEEFSRWIHDSPWSPKRI